MPGFKSPATRRLVVTDLGHFVLLNVYVPNAGGKERERAAFKAAYLHALTAKVDALLAAGREVMLFFPFLVSFCRRMHVLHQKGLWPSLCACIRLACR